jgi:hypothetical protein
MDITKEVPFVGFVRMKIHLGVETHQNVEPPSNVAITFMLRAWLAIQIYHADDVGLYCLQCNAEHDLINLIIL